MWCTGLPLDTVLVGVVHWVTIRYRASGHDAWAYCKSVKVFSAKIYFQANCNVFSCVKTSYAVYNVHVHVPYFIEQRTRPLYLPGLLDVASKRGQPIGNDLFTHSAAFYNTVLCSSQSQSLTVTYIAVLYFDTRWISVQPQDWNSTKLSSCCAYTCGQQLHTCG